MSTIHGISPVLDAYLAELEAATASLPSDERFEIRTSIEDHLSDLVAGRRHLDDAEARRIIDHLGPVSEITQTMPVTAGDTQVLPDATPMRPATPEPSARTAERGYSRLALVMAVACVIAFLLIPPVSIVLGIVAIVFGVLGLRAGERRAESWAGILVGALPLLLAAFWIPLGVTIGGGSASLFG